MLFLEKYEMNSDVVNQFNVLLQYDEVELIEKTTEIIATLAKKENYREIFSDTKLISKLCQILQQIKVNENKFNYGVIKQTCRALGNLCYENGRYKIN